MINAMTYNGYTANMVFDTEDKIIVGRVLDMDDIISFHGASEEEFEANFRVAVDGYVVALKKLESESK